VLQSCMSRSRPTKNRIVCQAKKLPSHQLVESKQTRFDTKKINVATDLVSRKINGVRMMDAKQGFGLEALSCSQRGDSKKLPLQETTAERSPRLCSTIVSKPAGRQEGRGESTTGVPPCHKQASTPYIKKDTLTG